MNPDDPIQLLPSEPHRERADSARNRARLLDTAQRLFEAQGVEEVTMSAVAEAAGVGKGTLYRHFPNKLELLQELIDSDQRELQNRTFSYLREHHHDPASALQWFLAEVMAFTGRNRALLFSENHDPAFSMLAHPAHQWWRLTIRGLLARLPLALDRDYATDLLYLLLDPRTVAWQQQRGLTMDEITAHLQALARQVIVRP